MGCDSSGRPNFIQRNTYHLRWLNLLMATLKLQSNWPCTIQQLWWLVGLHWPLMDGLLHLVQRGGAWGWRKYSELVLCKARGNSGVTASTSRHCNRRYHHCGVWWRWFNIAGQCHTGPGLPCLGAMGTSVWGSALLVVVFCVLVSRPIALLIEHEWGGPQHPAYEGVRVRGSCLWLVLASARDHEWLAILVFLSRMCCHKASWAVVQLVAFQGVRKEALYQAAW